MINIVKLKDIKKKLKENYYFESNILQGFNGTKGTKGFKGKVKIEKKNTIGFWFIIHHL